MSVKTATLTAQKLVEEEKGETKVREDAEIQVFTLKIYKRRWLMLGLFILYAMTINSQWVEYSIISNIVMRYYNVSSFAVDCTSMSFMFYYIPFVFPGTYLTERIGVRRTMILGSCLSCLGAWIKSCAVAADRFYVLLIGQSFVAITQALMLPIPGRIAAKWFGSSELSTATSVGIFGSQLGIAVSFLFPPMLVKNHEKAEDIKPDLLFLSLSIGAATTVTLILIGVLFQEEPKLPPSETRALQKVKRCEDAGEKEGFLPPMKRLLANRSFVVLCNSYGLNVGVLNVVGTMLNQLLLMHFKFAERLWEGTSLLFVFLAEGFRMKVELEKRMLRDEIFFQNGEEDAGRIGLLIIVTGMAGSVVFGIILDKTHKFKETTVTVYFLTLCGQVLFAVAIFLESKWMVYITASFLGFFMSGYLALGYELAAEYTYPEAESLSAGVLNIANNIYGIVLVMILSSFMQTYGDVPVHAGLCLVLLLGLIMTCLTKDEQRRQDARRAAIGYTNVKQTEEKQKIKVDEKDLA